jgi:hypothetical protein
MVLEDQAISVPGGADVDDPAMVDEDDGTMLVEVVLLEVDDDVGAVDAVESEVLGAGLA